MSLLADRYQSLLDRTNRPDPAAESIRSIFVEGKREQLLAGLDARGDAFAPLRPSTLANRRRKPGGPLVPGGASADLIVRYRVTVDPSPGRLEVSAGWPYPFVRYLRDGTRKMARRDPTGFRDVDRQQALTKLSEYLNGPSR